MDPIRVLIADDHPVVREGIAALLNRRADMIVVGEASDGQEALQLFQQAAPDVVLMDLRMPQMSGVEAIQAIRELDATARFIVLTTYDGDEDIYRALQAGAQAYLLKDTPRETLVETVRAVHAGERRIPPELASRLAERVFYPELTPREREVLQHIVDGENNGEIGRALSIAEGTVKAHVNSILTKLGASDRTHAASIALRRGLAHLD